MKAEIEATVKLWVDHIKGGTQDMGEGFPPYFEEYLTSKGIIL